MLFYSTAFLLFTILRPFAQVQADSAVFSQFIGATTAVGPSSGDLSFSFTICTNYLHGLPALTDFAPTNSAQLEQIAVDGVCQFCTSLDQSRIDSCCSQATSSACFDQFAASATTARTAPASVSATPTATSAGSSSSSSNDGAIARNKDLFVGSFVAAMVGVAAWML